MVNSRIMKNKPMTAVELRVIFPHIVDKQIIPDIPAIMGGVVYIAITISLVNLLIDILYAFLDPRIRSKMKQS